MAARSFCVVGVVDVVIGVGVVGVVVVVIGVGLVVDGVRGMMVIMDRG